MGNSRRPRRHGLDMGWLLVVVTATSAACGSASKTATTRSTSVPSTTIAPTSIETTTTPTTSAPPAAPGSSSTVPPGGLGVYTRPAPSNVQGSTSTLTLYADGHYNLDASSGVTGRWTYTNGKATFTETSDTTCMGIPGTYSWSYDGTHLSLTVANDTCIIRIRDFPAGPYTKGP